jgi:hypothetical protein
MHVLFVALIALIVGELISATSGFVTAHCTSITNGAHITSYRIKTASSLGTDILRTNTG